MALQCGIIGITNVGKTTIFNCVSNTKGETNAFAFSATKSNIGVVQVPDQRLYELEKHQGHRYEEQSRHPNEIPATDLHVLQQ